MAGVKTAKKEREPAMLLKDIKEIAKAMDINPGKMKKDELIHAIQLKEGNFACFGTAADGECDQMSCRWRQDCLHD